MPQEPPSPTDPGRETDMGRIALWLDPDDLRWLAAHCCCDDDSTEQDRERCARVRFRASAALHKATAIGDLDRCLDQVGSLTSYFCQLCRPG